MMSSLKGLLDAGEPATLSGPSVALSSAQAPPRQASRSAGSLMEYKKQYLPQGPIQRRINNPGGEISDELILTTLSKNESCYGPKKEWIHQY